MSNQIHFSNNIPNSDKEQNINKNNNINHLTESEIYSPIREKMNLFSLSQLKSSLLLTISPINNFHINFTSKNNNTISKGIVKEYSNNNSNLNQISTIPSPIKKMFKKINFEKVPNNLLINNEQKNNFIQSYEDSFASYCGIEKQQFINIFFNNSFKPIVNDFGDINISFKCIFDILKTCSFKKKDFLGVTINNKSKFKKDRYKKIFKTQKNSENLSNNPKSNEKNNCLFKVVNYENNFIEKNSLVFSDKNKNCNDCFSIHNSKEMKKFNDKNKKRFLRKNINNISNNEINQKNSNFNCNKKISFSNNNVQDNYSKNNIDIFEANSKIDFNFKENRNKIFTFSQKNCKEEKIKSDIKDYSNINSISNIKNNKNTKINTLGNFKKHLNPIAIPNNKKVINFKEPMNDRVLNEDKELENISIYNLNSGTNSIQKLNMPLLNQNNIYLKKNSNNEEQKNINHSSNFNFQNIFSSKQPTPLPDYKLAALSPNNNNIFNFSSTNIKNHISHKNVNEFLNKKRICTPTHLINFSNNLGTPIYKPMLSPMLINGNLSGHISPCFSGSNLSSPRLIRATSPFAYDNIFNFNFSPYITIDNNNSPLIINNNINFSNNISNIINNSINITPIIQSKQRIKKNN